MCATSWPVSWRIQIGKRRPSRRSAGHPASILPISTAYAVCEGLGLESGLDKRFTEAPIFYWLYTVLIVAGAVVLLLPRFPLVYVMVLSQVVNGMVLLFVLIFMLLLTND